MLRVQSWKCKANSNKPVSSDNQSIHVWREAGEREAGNPRSGSEKAGSWEENLGIARPCTQHRHTVCSVLHSSKEHWEPAILVFVLRQDPVSQELIHMPPPPECLLPLCVRARVCACVCLCVRMCLCVHALWHSSCKSWFSLPTMWIQGSDPGCLSGLVTSAVTH